MHAELMGSADPGTSRDPVYLSGGYIHTVFSCILGVTAVCPAGVKPPTSGHRRPLVTSTSIYQCKYPRAAISHKVQQAEADHSSQGL